MTVLRLLVVLSCLLGCGVVGRQAWSDEEREALNQQYWRSVLDLFKTQKNTDEVEARGFLEYYNKNMLELLNNQTLAQWAYTTNITDHNDRALQAAWARRTKFQAEANFLASRFHTAGFSADSRRQFSKVLTGSKALPTEEMEEMGELKAKLGAIYAKTKVCLEPDRCLSLEPGLTEIMASSTNTSEKLRAWQGWRTQVGRQSKPLYHRFIQLKNKKAVLNGFEVFKIKSK